MWKQHSILINMTVICQVRQMTVSNTCWKVTVLCLNKHPWLLCGTVLSCDSDELECYITSGGEGSDWQKVADGNDIQTQATFQYNELQGPKHTPPQDTTPSDISVCFTVQQLLNKFVRQNNNYVKYFSRPTKTLHLTTGQGIGKM